jgi:hypothetical protein
MRRPAKSGFAAMLTVAANEWVLLDAGGLEPRFAVRGLA